MVFQFLFFLLAHQPEMNLNEKKNIKQYQNMNDFQSVLLIGLFVYDPFLLLIEHFPLEQAVSFPRSVDDLRRKNLKIN